MSKILLYFGSEQSTFEFAGLTAGNKNDLFSDDRRVRFSSVEDEAGKKDASPFREIRKGQVSGTQQRKRL